MKRQPKEFEASINVSFNVSFTVLSKTEEQAQTKIENLLEIMVDEATVDCHIHEDYDVHIDEVGAKLNHISQW